MQWIQDEIPLASIPSALEDVKSLFDRAVEDYLCKATNVLIVCMYLFKDYHFLCLAVQVWIEYCSFALEKMSEMGGVGFVRDVFEKAIMEVGLHSAEVGGVDRMVCAMLVCFKGLYLVL